MKEIEKFRELDMRILAKAKTAEWLNHAPLRGIIDKNKNAKTPSNQVISTLLGDF